MRLEVCCCLSRTCVFERIWIREWILSILVKTRLLTLRNAELWSYVHICSCPLLMWERHHFSLLLIVSLNLNSCYSHVLKSRYTYLHIATKVENNFYGFQLYRSWQIEILECVLMMSSSASFFGILQGFGVFSILTMYIIFILALLHTSSFTIIVECFGTCLNGTSITFLSSYLEFEILS